MRRALIFPDSITDLADGGSPALVCSYTDGGVAASWVHVAGALDIVTAPQLERTLGDAQLQAWLVLLDLRELTFIDRAGVQVIVKASLSARLAGRRLVLLRGVPDVDRMFALTGSADKVEIGDVGLDAETRPRALQRSLVSSSLLKTGENARERRSSH